MRLLAICILLSMSIRGAILADDLVQSLANAAAFRSRINNAIIGLKYTEDGRSVNLERTRRQYEELGDKYKTFIDSLSKALAQPDHVRSAVSAAQALDRDAEAFLATTTALVGRGNTTRSLLAVGPFVQLAVSALLRAKTNRHDRLSVVGEVSRATSWPVWQEIR